MDRRIGWIAVLGGGLLALAVQIAGPIGVPLYDGVVVQEPYRFLHPGSGQPGSPASYSQAYDLEGGATPVIVAATTENPPQAQLIAQDDAFEVTPGTTSVSVSITPIEPPPPPAGGTIAGNVYEFAVVDQAGKPLALKACQGCRSLLLRAPDGTGEATIKRYANGTWIDVETTHAPATGLFQTNATALGDYAIVAVPEPTPGISPIYLVAGAALILLLGAGAFLLLKVRQAPPEPSPGRGRTPGAPPTRIPSKRKGGRRPPTGRSRP